MFDTSGEITTIGNADNQLATHDGRDGHVLLVAPSAGLGGGIERYISTVESAFEVAAIPRSRLNLVTPGRSLSMSSRIELVRAARGFVHASAKPVRVVFGHVNLLPIVRFVRRAPSYAGATVILHGAEIWSGRKIRNRALLRAPDVRVVAVSQFSAGALISSCRATVLHPGIADDWYELLTYPDLARAPKSSIDVLSVFRLEDWKAKGVETLIEGIGMLADPRIRLTLCGSGPTPPALVDRVQDLPWCRVRANLSDAELAMEYKSADLFVLCTTTKPGRASYGEGFGMVLLEAQLAGTPVVAPAYGGSGDSYDRGSTGLAPLNESPAALAAVLAPLMADPDRLARMGAAASTWARTRYEPATFGQHIVEVLTGGLAG